jgi:hypothetical protein
MASEGIFNRMEEVFAQKVIATKRAVKKEKKQEISIIDSRKAYNISKFCNNKMTLYANSMDKVFLFWPRLKI